MNKRDLIIYVPVIHKGYLEFFSKYKKTIGTVYLIDRKFVSKLSPHEPDIASLETKTVGKILITLGVKVNILHENAVTRLVNEKLLLINDKISRSIHKKYFKESDVVFKSVFLRWDKDSVITTNPVNAPESLYSKDKSFMQNAYQEAEKSSDWWRQVGAVLVKNGKCILRAYNEGVPNDTEPYTHGAIRDFLEVGELQEFSTTIHAEQLIIARAAKEGFSLGGTKLYVTHFPCSVCAKLIAHSGIDTCYFSQGSSNCDGGMVLKQAGVSLFLIPISK